MGTTMTVIYPVDPEYKPPQAAVDRLKALGDGLAAFVGFPESPHFTPRASVVEQYDLYFSVECEIEPVWSSFAIVVKNALRYTYTTFEWEGRSGPEYDTGVEADKMAEMEELLGTKLAQMNYVL
ncbi:MAG TPA: hypothetical protein VGK74_26985 [Symbiobacteriaceae bacterium]|jgi:hypothetical protein